MLKETRILKDFKRAFTCMIERGNELKKEFGKVASADRERWAFFLGVNHAVNEMQLSTMGCFEKVKDTKPKVCRQCSGSGMVDLVGNSIRCEKCDGTGMKIEDRNAKP